MILNKKSKPVSDSVALVENSKVNSVEKLIQFFTDISCIAISPFVLEFFIRSMQKESMMNGLWIVPLWVLMIFSTALDNKTVAVNDKLRAKGILVSALVICAVIYAMFFVSVSLGVMGVFNSLGDDNKVWQGFMYLFFFIIAGFYYAAILLTPAFGQKKTSIAPPQKKFYINMALMPIATNFSALFFVAFWIYKIPPSENSSTISVFHIIGALLLMGTLILMCGAPRLMQLIKRYNHTALAGFLLFFLWQSVYIMLKY